MSDSQSVAAQLILQILSVHSPEPGARLKQRLKKAFVASGHGEFDEKALGFQKFTDYLLHKHGDLIKIVKPDGSGDIQVFLRSTTEAGGNRTTHEITSDIIRNDVWQAFVNPDPERYRFFHKETGRVLHFLNSENSAEKQEVESDHRQYIKITPIPGEDQVGWMREFLAELDLASEEKSPLESIVSGPYSVAMNAIFIRSLGRYSIAWKNFRASRVSKIIQSWASGVGVDFSALHEKSRTKPVIEKTHSPTTPDQKLPPKQQVIRLLDLLSEEDVSRLVLPTLLSTILIKSRL
ncbi:TPA: OST-HTH/LOTUS domain-containing protein [Pseudomonas aeruginosa]|nr:OST-HTH/LOTUS domain-containing protein [Pseudomonas aeruginosa]